MTKPRTRKMRLTRITPLFVALTLSAFALLFAHVAEARRQDQSQPNAGDDVLMRAMQDELARSVSRLRLKEAEKPYFVEYAVDDVEAFDASATFGAITSRSHARTRAFTVRVRVGSYDLDNTGFVTNASLFGGESSSTALVAEDDYDALRQDMWLLTDAAYKRAVEQLAGKRAFLQNKTAEDKSPDFSREQPAVEVAPARSLQIDEAKWGRQVREWSAVFRQFPSVNSSSVRFRAQVTNRYVVNSEGTRLRQPSSLVFFEASAAAQTADGFDIEDSAPIRARGLDSFPAPDEVTATIRRMAGDLTALRAAPALEGKYLGPVLFTGQASAELFAQMLAPHLSGDRPPVSDNPYMEEENSALVDRLNRPVLAPFLSVYDDPTTDKEGGQTLLGAYRFDDEGVPAKRVSLVEDGVLKGLLMSRRPREGFQHSNGHGRSDKALIGNLFVRASGGKSLSELKQQLVNACRAQKLPYGIIVRSLAPDATPDGKSLSAPLLAYKVYVDDGREELIRGVTVEDISVRALRQVLAAGDDAFAYNTFYRGQRASVVAPPVLLEEVELNKIKGTQPKPLILTHPYFNK